jgi:hypothetical protein
MQLHRIALAVAAAFPFVVWAQGIATEAQLKTVQVAGSRAPLDPNLPSSTASKTAEQLREQNIYNPEDIAVNCCPVPPCASATLATAMPTLPGAATARCSRAAHWCIWMAT